MKSPIVCWAMFVILVVWCLLPRVARLMSHTPTAITRCGCLSIVQLMACYVFLFFQAEDGIRDLTVTGVQTCALPIYPRRHGHAGRLADRHFPERLSRRGDGRHRSDHVVQGAGARRPHTTSARGSHRALRSEERSVGKECRSRWSAYH